MQLPNMVTLNAVGYRKAQMQARKRVRKKLHKRRVQKSVPA